MGEIVFSLCIGGFLALSGIIMNLVLSHEEKGLHPEDDNGDSG